MSDTLFGNEKTWRREGLVRLLHSVPGWPVDHVKDDAYVGVLMEQFPALDLEEQIRKFALNVVSENLAKEITSRGRWKRLGNWCAVAARPARRGPGAPAGGKGARTRRTSTAARPASAFGDESSQSLSRW